MSRLLLVLIVTIFACLKKRNVCCQVWFIRPIVVNWDVLKFAAKQRPNFFSVVFDAWCTSDAFRHCGTPWTIWSSQPPSSCCCHLWSASFKLHVMTLLGGSMIGTFKCTLGVAKFQTTACPHHSDQFCLSWKIYLAKFHQLVFSNSQLRCLKDCRETTFQCIIGVRF